MTQPIVTLTLDLDRVGKLKPENGPEQFSQVRTIYLVEEFYGEDVEPRVVALRVPPSHTLTLTVEPR